MEIVESCPIAKKKIYIYIYILSTTIGRHIVTMVDLLLHISDFCR